MSLNLSVNKEVTKNLEKYEGRIPHLYLDTVGNVTVGIGHLIPNKAAMDAIKMYKTGANNQLVLANKAEKYAEYDAIKILPYGRRISASSFKSHSTLIMEDVDINLQCEKHIQSFYKELTSYYNSANGFKKPFDAMPIEVQKALFDMVFNLGLTKLKKQYIYFNTAIKNEKWSDAAKQSNRVGINAMRNKYVFDLLSAAQKQSNNP